MGSPGGSGGGLGGCRWREEPWKRQQAGRQRQQHGTHTHTPKTMPSKTLDEGRRVGHGHGAVIWDREQLIRRHGDPVPGGAVGEGDVGQAEDVQLSVRQMLSENWRKQSYVELWLRGPALELTVFVPERGRPGRARRGGKAMRGAEVSCQRLLCRVAAVEVGDVGVQSCRS